VSPEDELQREAEAIVEHLRAVRLTLKRPIAEAIAQSGLTAPQVGVLRVLTEAGGLTLKDLCGRLGLAHSTVSGIVDRLERRGLVQRERNTADRRFTQILLTDKVKTFLATGSALHRPAPLVDALRQASRAERSLILQGLTTLRQALERASARTQDAGAAASERARRPMRPKSAPRDRG
jgi:DNA-binding MarR family transcriptional regulator